MQYLDGTDSQKPMQKFVPCIRKSKAKKRPQNPTPRNSYTCPALHEWRQTLWQVGTFTVS